MTTDARVKGYRLAGMALIAFGLILSFVLGTWLIGFGAFVVGFSFLATSYLIDGVPNLLRFIWRSAEPVWDGEILHTDSGDSAVRYGFEPQGSPWFVAADICQAIGEKTVDERALHREGIHLIRRNNLAAFSGEHVCQFLTKRSVDNHLAKRLLVLIQSTILRKIDLERDKERRYS